MSSSAAGVSGESYGFAFDAERGVITLTGALHGRAARQLHDDLDAHVTAARSDTWVDLSSVTSLPSEAIGVLVRAQTTAGAHGGVLRLRSARGTIARRVLEICRLQVVD